jgi:Sec-independent protein secretion pathway component TatC
MKIETDKPAGLVLTELVFKNLFWFLIFSAVYANINPLEWWLTQNVWGRVLLVLLELGILTSTFYENEKK